MTENSYSERRSELRHDADDIVRWKRPGRIEDHKAFIFDRSDSGMGFVVEEGIAPQIGEVLNIRQLDRDRWITLDRIVRVARRCRLADPNLISIGCTVK